MQSIEPCGYTLYHLVTNFCRILRFLELLEHLTVEDQSLPGNSDPRTCGSTGTDVQSVPENKISQHFLRTFRKIYEPNPRPIGNG